jgi:DNA-binding GntR family transcriptional regulator
VVIDHDSPVPLHQQLAAILRGRIESGDLAGRVPSILTLSQEYEVGHNTVYRAMTTLRNEGLIVAARGRGYYVVRP